MSGELDHLGRKFPSVEHCALHRRTIKLTCRTCGHVRKFDAVAIWAMFRRRQWAGELEKVPKRFYCGTCWQQHFRRSGVPRMEITDEQPEGPQPPYPDEREWKKLVSRYRS